MLDSFTKVISPGTGRTQGGRAFGIFCKIIFAGGCLSITGVEGPLPSGNCLGSCGQIVDGLEVAIVNRSPGWSPRMVARFVAYWRRWHFNGMRAGSPRQSDYLRKHPISVVFPESRYEKERQALTDAGLNPDTEYNRDGEPYAYGSAWLHEDVPDSVLAWLRALPDTPVIPAWVLS